MTKELTIKQKNFCRNIVAGLSNAESYIKAYNCNSESAASVESTKLLKRDDITEYIQELERPINNLTQNSIINERKKQIEYIKSRIVLCEKREDEQSIIRYTDMLNKILALYKESETEQKTESTVNNLDTDTLIKLSKIS